MLMVTDASRPGGARPRADAPSARSILRRAVLGSVLLAWGCGGAFAGSPGRDDRYHRKKMQESLARFETPGLVLGEFTLGSRAIIDGDTLKVEGLRTTMRLIALDAEETFKNEPDRRAAELDFESYLKKKRGTSMRPVKVATPLGEDAKHFAEAFFADVRTVRIERDHPKELRDRYNRYLTYVFAQKDGVWKNYNVEAVRAGMSPYFTKYGLSRRFHDEFVAAENEAKAKKVGIWDPRLQHCRDYDEREAWWNARGQYVLEFEKEAEEHRNYIVLTHWDALSRLESFEGKEVVLLGAISEIKLGDRGPTTVSLGRRLVSDFPLVFFDKDTFGATGLVHYRGEFIRVKGFVNRYFNKFKRRDDLQIVVNLPGQIQVSPVPGLDARKTRME